ncbi:MAG: pyridoxamine 5'-phosphate oxidase family protein [Desulfopila sp.]|jgi:hypothetical protein|nr:pyridoxamine 5'-phosphate oxidase family protein [Desulfopila sp.]
MKLHDYFENNKGRGVLSTADRAGNVNAAVYARPHMMEDQQIAFIMRDRLSHKNIQENPHAAYLFMTEGQGYSGVRLYLEKVSETENAAEIDELQRRKKNYEEEAGPRFLVYFKVTKILPLIGDGESDISL